jgi:predicted alpha/beta superfamily hydrolase
MKKSAAQFLYSTWLRALLLLAIWAGQQPVCAQSAPLCIGETFTLTSKALGETRRLNVYVPPIYHDSASIKLPVLYMPDGGLAEDFLHVAGLVQVLTSNGTMRPFILVGIENTERRRDLTGPTTNPEDRKIAPRVSGSAAFRRFIRTELMPAIQQRYRTTAETAVVGESLAGLFVVETLLQEPDLFDAYLAFDPSLWWNNEYLVGQADKLLQAYSGPKKVLYLAAGSQPDIADETRRLATTLRTVANPRISWRYEPRPQETHATIYHPAALHAFRTIFKPRLAPKTN